MRLAMVACLAIEALGAIVVACDLPDDPPLGARRGPPLDPDGFTAAEVARIRQLSPLPPLPPDPTNAFADDPGAAELGQRLFFDKSFSGALTVGDDGTNGGLGAVGESGKVSCASCHSSKATDDARTVPNTVSLGTDYGTRNTLGIINSSFYRWTNWGGRFDSQWSLSLAVAENPRIMKSSRLQISHGLYDKYRADYDAVFPVPLDRALASMAPDAGRFPPQGKPKAAPTDPDGPWEQMAPADRMIVNLIYANFGKSIAAYVRLNASRDAPFDRYVAGDRTAIDASAKRGLKVFLERGCVSCHSGPNFSDDQFHNIGVEQAGAHVPEADTGRFGDIAPLLASEFNSVGAFSDDPNTGRLTGLAATPANMGQFRTPGLRGVSNSAPFMHAGQLATLEAVIEHYSTGGPDHVNTGEKDARIIPLHLTTLEAADLVAFLKTLDGAPVPSALLVDTSR